MAVLFVDVARGCVRFNVRVFGTSTATTWQINFDVSAALRTKYWVKWYSWEFAKEYALTYDPGDFRIFEGKWK